ncbi:MAG: hypothetical protein JHC31_05250 [Sulfurihydrogenibium sp.]|jgi:hypothetical protein|nr:hypothetical protein [Sulfurihydrogenibium sp.]
MKIRIPIKIEDRSKDIHIPIPIDEPDKWNFKISGSGWSGLYIIIEEMINLQNKGSFTEKTIERTIINLKYLNRMEFPKPINLEIDTAEKTIEATVPIVVEKKCCKYEVLENRHIVSKFGEKITIPLKSIYEENKIATEKHIEIDNVKKEKIIQRIHKKAIEKETEDEFFFKNGFFKLKTEPEKSIFIEYPVENGKILIGKIKESSVKPATITLKTKLNYLVMSRIKKKYYCEEIKPLKDKYSVWIKTDKDKGEIIIRYKEKEYKMADALMRYLEIPLDEQLYLIFGDSEHTIQKFR